MNASVTAEHNLNVFQANLWPCPKKVDKVSQPVKANHTGITWHILSPRFSAYSWIESHSKLTPVPNSIHNSSRSNLSNRLIAMTTTSVSTVFNDTLQCPVADKSFRCKNILVLASSWLHGEKRSMSIVDKKIMFTCWVAQTILWSVLFLVISSAIKWNNSALFELSFKNFAQSWTIGVYSLTDTLKPLPLPFLVCPLKLKGKNLSNTTSICWTHSSLRHLQTES